MNKALSSLSIAQLFSIVLVLFALLFLASVTFADWHEPTAAAPSGNVAAPINVGMTDQVKDAGLGLNKLAVFGGGYFQGNVGVGTTNPAGKLDIEGGNICLNGACISTWPTGGGDSGGGGGGGGSDVHVGMGIWPDVIYCPRSDAAASGTLTALYLGQLYGDAVGSGGASYNSPYSPQNLWLSFDGSGNASGSGVVSQGYPNLISSACGPTMAALKAAGRTRTF